MCLAGVFGKQGQRQVNEVEAGVVTETEPGDWPSVQVVGGIFCHGCGTQAPILVDDNTAIAEGSGRDALDCGLSRRVEKDGCCIFDAGREQQVFAVEADSRVDKDLMLRLRVTFSGLHSMTKSRSSFCRSV